MDEADPLPVRSWQMMNLTEIVKSLAIEAGFHAAGITSAEPFAEADRTLRERLRQGLLEGSGYDAEAIRVYTHPRESMPSARSIISVALSYLHEEASDSDGVRGWVARFARGADYHRVLRERLLSLAGNIQTRLGRRAEMRTYADTGPLVDRSAAIRAGVGSRGRNTCVYAGEYGSWVVLGELATDIDLQPDEPGALDLCSGCANRCMEACPTGAICAPYVVDVRICISHITQSKGYIPHELREKLGTRIYGCDTCQSACPQNDKAKRGNVAEFAPSRGIGAHPDLLSLLNIGVDEFRARIGPTTIGWIRRTRFRRNVAVALGNIGDPAAVPELVEALGDREPIIRGHAAWALGKIGGSGARVALEHALSRETDPVVAGEIESALERS